MITISSDVYSRYILFVLFPLEKIIVYNIVWKKEMKPIPKINLLF